MISRLSRFMGSYKWPPILLKCASIMLLLPLAGCGSFTPFSIDAGSIDEDSPQTSARIRLSPPQVFTRERLINDRLKESKFLDDQLERSAKDPLGTSLARDLQTISALGADLSASFDPAVKLNFQNSSQQADLQQQIVAAQLQGQLITSKNQLKALETGTGPGPTGLTKAPDTTVQSNVDTQASDDRLKSLHERIDNTIDKLSQLTSASQRSNLLTGTLEDEFEDRLALRARIREAINANALDDAHDMDGNALYHLQFTASILPGKNKSQFGLARLRIEPPQFTQDDIDLLYFTWLAYLSSRMNQTIEKLENDEHDNKKVIESKKKEKKKYNERLSYSVLGPMTGLYDVARVKLDESEILIAVPPGHKNGLEYSQEYNKQVIVQANLLLTKSQKDLLDSLKALPTTLDGLLDFASALISTAPSVQTAVFSLEDRSDIDESIKTSMRNKLMIFINSYVAVQWILNEFKAACKKGDIDDEISCLKVDEWQIKWKPWRKKTISISAPDVFCQGLLDASCPGYGTALQNSTPVADKKGVAYPYSADPVLRTQRVSTIASAANALDLAMAISAQVPKFPISLGGSSGYSQRAAARADTIEHVPQVFGFAGSYKEDITNENEKSKETTWYTSTSEKKSNLMKKQTLEGAEKSLGNDVKYEFGWVFGPKLVLDPGGNKLLLRQNARTEKVSADISVPSWWPRATLSVTTGWKGNFSGEGEFLEEGKDQNIWGHEVNRTAQYELPVRFKLNATALDAMTVRLAQALIAQGFHQARIDRVEPDTIQLCRNSSNKKLTLLIYGMDLWRNPKIFYGGAESTSIEVLPDMVGISVVIDPSLLSKVVSGNGKELTLTIWTSHGSASFPLPIEWGVCSEESSGATRSSVLQIKSNINSITRDNNNAGNFPIQLTSPSPVSSITLSVNGANFTKDPSQSTDHPELSVKLVGDSIKIINLDKLPKDNRRFTIDLGLKNFENKIVITATPELKDDPKPVPAELSLNVIPPK